MIPAAHLAEIERRYLAAETPAAFVPELARAWRKSKRTVWRYVARVRARLAARAKLVDPDADRELVRAMLLNAYRVAERGGEKGPNAAAMVQASKTLAEVTGIAAPLRIEHSGKIATDPQTLHDRIAAAVARVAGDADAGAARAADGPRAG